MGNFPEVGNSPDSKNRSPHGPAKSIVTRPCALLLLFFRDILTEIEITIGKQSFYSVS